MLTVGVIGLFVNVGAAWILHSSAEHSVNVEGAFQHVMADLMGSVGVVISGILIWAFGWTIADPIISVGIGILILLSTWRLLAKVVHVLLEGTPEHIDVYKLCSKIEEVEGVTLIHDVHVWTIAPRLRGAHRAHPHRSRLRGRPRHVAPPSCGKLPPVISVSATSRFSWKNQRKDVPKTTMLTICTPMRVRRLTEPDCPPLSRAPHGPEVRVRRRVTTGRVYDTKAQACVQNLFTCRPAPRWPHFFNPLAQTHDALA